MRRQLTPPPKHLLFAEGLAVGTLIFGGIHLMGTHLDLVQRAVIRGIAVVSALLNGACDALVCIAVHCRFLLFSEYAVSMCHQRSSIHIFSSVIAFQLKI